MLYWIVPPQFSTLGWNSVSAVASPLSGSIPKVVVEMPARNGIADLAGDGDRPDPGQCVRKIAEPFAEINRRRVGVERLRANALRARSAPFDAEADRHHELMFGVS